MKSFTVRQVSNGFILELSFEDGIIRDFVTKQKGELIKNIKAYLDGNEVFTKKERISVESISEEEQ